MPYTGKFNCRSCGEMLSTKELNEYKDSETPISEFICNECFEMENQFEPEIDSFSDADPGL